MRSRACDAVPARVGRGEERDRRRAERRREMREAGVDADDERRVREQRRDIGQRTATRARSRSRMPCARRRLRASSPALPHGSTIAKPARSKRVDQRAPVRLGPQLVGAARRVQQRRRTAASGVPGAAGGYAQVPARRPVDRVAERRAGETPAARRRSAGRAARDDERRRAAWRAARACSRGRSRGGARARCARSARPLTCSCRSRIAV